MDTGQDDQNSFALLSLASFKNGLGLKLDGDGRERQKSQFCTIYTPHLKLYSYKSLVDQAL